MLFERQDQNQDKVHLSFLLEKTKKYSEYREERVLDKISLILNQVSIKGQTQQKEEGSKNFFLL